MVTKQDQPHSESSPRDYGDVVAQVRQAHKLLCISLGPEVMCNVDVPGTAVAASTAPPDPAIVHKQAAHLARLVGELLRLLDEGQGSPTLGHPLGRTGAAMQVESARRGTAQATDHASKTSLVLVVDDNQDAADMLASLVEHLGYEAMVAHDGPSALALVKQRRPDVALLDIGLPVMDGYELAAHLRNEPSLKNLRILAITGHSLPKDRQRTAAAGFDAHLLKPLDALALAKVLSEN